MSGVPSNDASPRAADTAVDRLQELLQRQLALVHQGRLAAAVELFDQTEHCVREIRNRIPRPESAPQWPGVECLYRELSLALTAQRAEVSAALKAIRQGKRALSVYSSTVFFPR